MKDYLEEIPEETWEYVESFFTNTQKQTVMNKKDQIIKAWEILNDLTGSIQCGCNIEKENIINIRCLYIKCKDFINAVDKKKGTNI